MISFVWSSKYPFLAGAGGSENYTAGQIRELQRRGIKCRILTLGFGKDDGRQDFPDITFKDLPSADSLSDLDDTIVFITYPLNVPTKKQSYVILHCPPPISGTHDPLLIDPQGISGKRVIAPSKYAAKGWARYFTKTTLGMHVAYPFAEREFSAIERPDNKTGKTRFLFAGRLTPDKGIYTLLSALHMDCLQDKDYQFTITASGSHTHDGKVLTPLLQAHPQIDFVPARKNSQEMAQLMSEHDVLLMPTTDIFWKEMFGIVSIEAQHAGMRVVGAKTGGIPETNCGGLLLVKPDNPVSLADGIMKAAQLGPLTQWERTLAASQFTVKQSVDSLLKALGWNEPQQTGQLHEPGVRVPRLYPQLGLFPLRLKR